MTADRHTDEELVRSHTACLAKLKQRADDQQRQLDQFGKHTKEIWKAMNTVQQAQATMAQAQADLAVRVQGAEGDAKEAAREVARGTGAKAGLAGGVPGAAALLWRIIEWLRHLG